MPPTLGGENKAASPTALLLGALSGCAVLFIRDTLAPQLGVRVDSVQAEVRCKADFRGLLAMPGAVPDLQDLEITIQIQSPESEEKVQGLYQVSRGFEFSPFVGFENSPPVDGQSLGSLR